MRDGSKLGMEEVGEGRDGREMLAESQITLIGRGLWLHGGITEGRGGGKRGRPGRGIQVAASATDCPCFISKKMLLHCFI